MKRNTITESYKENTVTDDPITKNFLKRLRNPERNTITESHKESHITNTIKRTLSLRNLKNDHKENLITEKSK